MFIEKELTIKTIREFSSIRWNREFERYVDLSKFRLFPPGRNFVSSIRYNALNHRTKELEEEYERIPRVSLVRKKKGETTLLILALSCQED